MKRLILLFLFCGFLMGVAYLFNNYLFGIPFFGRWNKYVELSHWVTFGTLGVITAWKKSDFMFVAFLIWAGLHEAIQIPMLNRYGDIIDVVRNVGGFLSGYFIISVGRDIKKALDEKCKNKTQETFGPQDSKKS